MPRAAYARQFRPTPQSSREARLSGRARSYWRARKTRPARGSGSTPGSLWKTEPVLPRQAWPRQRSKNRWWNASRGQRRVDDSVTRRRLPGSEGCEKAIRSPGRRVFAIGDANQEIRHELDVLPHRSKVHRLVEIIGRRMVSLGKPLLLDPLPGAAEPETGLERHCRYPQASEAVLIAADEAISQRLRIRLHFDAECRRNRPDVRTEIRLLQSEYD